MHRSCFQPLAAAAVLYLGTLVPAGPAGLPDALADDFPVIENPAQPARGSEAIALEEIWKISGDDEDVLLGVTSRVEGGPDGSLYFLDMQLTEVQVFSPDGEYLRSIGREGEGPGEFRQPGDMFLLPDGLLGVVQRRPGKVVLLTTEGDPAGELPIPGTETGSVFLGNGRAADGRIYLQVNQGERTDTGFKSHNRILAIDREGNILGTFHESDIVRDFANPTFDEKETFGARSWEVGPGGEYYEVASFDDYRIEVRNPDGTPRYAIERDYDPRKRSEEEQDQIKGRIMIRGRGRMQIDMKVSPTDPAIVNLYPRPDGTLWVLSSRGAYDAEEGTLASFDVFDSEGRFVSQVSLTGDGNYRKDGLFFAGDDRLIVIRELNAARRAMFGGSDEEEDEEVEEVESDPLSVVCYTIPSLRAGGTAGN